MKQLTIIVDWYGPYNLEDAIHAAKNDDYRDGLYMAMGRKNWSRESIKPQYIGLSKTLRLRLKSNAILKSIKDVKIWLGEVATAEPSGKKRKRTKSCLDYAEWLHAYFMQIPLNQKKRKSPPPQSVTLINRWWKTDLETPRKRRPHSTWPDLFDYPYKDYPVKIVWFGRALKFIEKPYIL